MLSSRAGIVLLAFISESVLGEILVQNLTISDKNGINTCSLYRGRQLCHIKTHESITLHFNVTVDQDVSQQSFSVFIGQNPIINNAELCYNSAHAKVEVVATSKKPSSCFIWKSNTPYPVAVTFTLAEIKGDKLTLNVGPANTSVGIISNDGKNKYFVRTWQPGPLPAILGEGDMSNPALVDCNGIETCQTSKGRQVCTVYPGEEMTLRFDYSLHSIAVRKKFSLSLGNATILSEATVCYSFNPKKVFIQTKATKKQVCYTTVYASGTPFTVDVTFGVPPFEGEELVFYLGSARGSLILRSDSSDKQRSCPAPTTEQPTTTAVTPTTTTMESTTITVLPTKTTVSSPTTTMESITITVLPTKTTMPPTTTTEQPTTTTEQPTTTTEQPTTTTEQPTTTTEQPTTTTEKPTTTTEKPTTTTEKPTTTTEKPTTTTEQPTTTTEKPTTTTEQPTTRRKNPTPRDNPPCDKPPPPNPPPPWNPPHPPPPPWNPPPPPPPPWNPPHPPPPPWNPPPPPPPPWKPPSPPPPPWNPPPPPPPPWKPPPPPPPPWNPPHPPPPPWNPPQPAPWNQHPPPPPPPNWGNPPHWGG